MSINADMDLSQGSLCNMSMVTVPFPTCLNPEKFLLCHSVGSLSLTVSGETKSYLWHFNQEHLEVYCRYLPPAKRRLIVAVCAGTSGTGVAQVKPFLWRGPGHWAKVIKGAIPALRLWKDLQEGLPKVPGKHWF